MREIEFRAWLKNQNKMIKVIQLNLTMENVSDCFFNYYKFNEIELMQYTGLKDKNGVKIFEGDIVKRHIIKIYQVAWNDKESCWYIFNPDVKHNFSDISTLNNNVKNLEVIGNIYENEELLNERIRFY